MCEVCNYCHYKIQSLQERVLGVTRQIAAMVR